jgi:hypothetical protein
MIQILPGTQVSVSAGERSAELSVTGTVAMPLALSWGDTLTVINQGDSTKAALGYEMVSEKLKCVNEVMNGAEKLYLYRLNNSGAKASGTLADGITATAKYPGTRGNDISVVVTASGSNWEITTMLGTAEMDAQTVAAATDFKENDFISIAGTGTLEAITAELTGGTDGDIDTGAWDKFKAEMETHEFNVLAYTGTDEAVANGLITWVNEQRGKDNMIQLVQSIAAADNPAVYHSTSPGTAESYSLTAAEACATIAGLIAKQGITGSLTHYGSITGWTDAEHLTREQQQVRVGNGEILVVMLYGTPTVLYDINSLTTYTDAQPKDFHKGLIVRTLDKYAQDLKKLLDKKCIGKIRNSVNGRAQIKGMVVKMTTENYLNTGYIENFTADDVTISKGDESDTITADTSIQVVDTADKINIEVVSLEEA